MQVNAIQPAERLPPGSDRTLSPCSDFRRGIPNDDDYENVEEDDEDEESPVVREPDRVD
jgi:hypothetical protein